MAMTKAERAEMDRLREELALARALRYSGMQAPERMPLPDTGFQNGWSFNVHSGEVSGMWTERMAHGWGHRAEGGTGGSVSQNGRRIYSTRRDALIALRLAMEEQSAKKLAAIDALIERENTP